MLFKFDFGRRTKSSAHSVRSASYSFAGRQLAADSDAENFFAVMKARRRFPVWFKIRSFYYPVGLSSIV